MNKFIKEQLLNCKIAKIPKFDDDTTELVIEKGANEPLELEENKYYIIELDDFIINSKNSTLCINWNKGILPTSKYLLAIQINKINRMIQVDACGFDKYSNSTLSDVYSGLWLPREKIKIIGEMSNE